MPQTTTPAPIKLTRDSDGYHVTLDGHLWQVQRVPDATRDEEEGEWDVYLDHDHDNRVRTLAEARRWIAGQARSHREVREMNALLYGADRDYGAR